MKKTRILALLLAVSVLSSMLMVMPVSAAEFFTPTAGDNPGNVGTRKFEYGGYTNYKMYDQLRLTSFENQPPLDDMYSVYSGLTSYIRLYMENTSGAAYENGVYEKTDNDVSLKVPASSRIVNRGGLGLNIDRDYVSHLALQFAIPSDDPASSFVPVDFATSTWICSEDGKNTEWGNFSIIDGKGDATTPVKFTQDGNGKKVNVFGQDIPNKQWEAGKWYDIDVLLTHGAYPTMSVYIDGEPVNLTGGETFDGVKTTSVNVAIDGKGNKEGRQPIWGVSAATDPNVYLASNKGGTMYIDNLSFLTLKPGTEPILRKDIVEVSRKGEDAIVNSGKPGTVVDDYREIGAGIQLQNIAWDYTNADLYSVSMDIADAENDKWSATFGRHSNYMGVIGAGNGYNTRVYKSGSAGSSAELDSNFPTFYNVAAYKQSAYNFDGFVNHELIIDARHQETKQAYIGGVPQYSLPTRTVSDFNNAHNFSFSTKNEGSAPSKTKVDNIYYLQYIYKPQIKSLTYGKDGKDDLAVPYDTDEITLNLAGGIWATESEMPNVLANITITDSDSNSVAIKNRSYNPVYRTVTLTLGGALEASTNYQVKMPRDMMVYSRPNYDAKTLGQINGDIDYVYDFKTTEAPVFEVTASKLYEWTGGRDATSAGGNGDGKPQWGEYLDRSASGKAALAEYTGRVNAKITLRNTTGEPKKARFLFAIYDQFNVLQYFRLSDEVTVNGDGLPYEYNALDDDGLEHIVEGGGQWGWKYKVYVWSDLNGGMNPIHHEPLYLWCTAGDMLNGDTTNAKYWKWTKE